jgi:hypothetical protein
MINEPEATWEATWVAASKVILAAEAEAREVAKARVAALEVSLETKHTHKE